MKSYLTVTLFFLTVFGGLLTANAQSKFTTKEIVELLQNIDESLGNIKTIVYKIDYKNKLLSSRDTVNTTAVCSLYIAPKGRMKIHHIVDMKESNSYGHRRYDGKRVFSRNYAINTLDVYKEPYIDEDKDMIESVIVQYKGLLLSNYLMQKKPFSRYKSAAQEIIVSEEVYNNEPVYVLLWGVHGPDEVCGEAIGLKKHVIRKSDYLPVAFTYIFKCENMIQYDSAEIEYLNINPDIPLENFKVDKDEAIKPVQRYNEFKKKVNIED